MLQDQNDEDEFFMRQEDQFGLTVDSHIITGMSKSRNARCGSGSWTANSASDQNVLWGGGNDIEEGEGDDQIAVTPPNAFFRSVRRSPVF